MTRLLRIIAVALLCGISAESQSKTIYMATNGDDRNAGTMAQPLASFGKAYALLMPGDTLYIRGGVYKITPAQIMNDISLIYTDVFYLGKKGTADKPLSIMGFPKEKVVFDMKEIRPSKRVTTFYIKGDYHHLKNFEVIHTQVTQTGHTQSECFRNDGGNYNLYEGLKMHDGMGIGFYLTGGSHNLILNCDAYNIDDPVSEGGRNENTDGFGCHPRHASDVGNVFRGCRAWHCGDDGFDLINAMAPVTIEHCRAIANGYRADGSRSGGNGNGFKAGGYGMKAPAKVPDVIPQHIVRECLACDNAANGFYANHHPGGIRFLNNTACGNARNFNMLNRVSAAEAVNTPGYGHTLRSNVSFRPRSANGDITDINPSVCTLSNNTFLPEIKLKASDFQSLNAGSLIKERAEDGSLPATNYMVPAKKSVLFQRNMGYTF